MIISPSSFVLEPSPTNTLFQAIQGHSLQFISPFFRWKKKITAFLQTPIKDEGEGVPSWEKKLDIKLWSVEEVLIVGGRWEGLHLMKKNREVNRFFFGHNVVDLIIIPGKFYLVRCHLELYESYKKINVASWKTLERCSDRATNETSLDVRKY